MSKLVKVIVAAAAAVVSLGAFATDYTWTGGGDGKTWTDPENWGKTAAGDFPEVGDRGVFSANTTATIEVGEDLAFNYVILRAGANLTFKSADGAPHVVTFAGAISSDGASDLTIDGIELLANYDHTLKANQNISVVNGGRFQCARLYTAAGCAITVSRGSTFYASNIVKFLYDNEVRVSDRSLFECLTEVEIAKDAVLTIDDATVRFAGNGYLGMNAPGGGRVVFKGANPVFECTSGTFRANGNAATYTTDFNFDFEIPCGGYREVPIRASGATAFDSMASCPMKYNFNVLASSPALLAGTRLEQDLMMAKGIVNARVGAAGAGTAIRFLALDRTDKEASATATDRKILSLTVNPDAAAEQPRETVTQTLVSDGYVTSVARRQIKIERFEVTRIATDGTRTRVTIEGGLTDDPSAFTDNLSYEVAYAGPYAVPNSLYWQSPKLTFQPCFIRLRIDQLNADDQVVSTAWTAVKSATTVDSATYTWQAADGVWDGVLTDRAHWKCSVTDEEDRYDYPLHASSSVQFPKNCTATLTIPASVSVGTIKFTEDNQHITFVSAGNDTNKVLTIQGMSCSAAKADGTIALDHAAIYSKGGVQIESHRDVLVRDSSFVVNGDWGNHRPDYAHTVLENSSFTCGSLRLGGADTLFVISNSTCSATGVELCRDRAGGKLRFEGRHPVLTLRSNSFLASTDKMAGVLEFVIPDGGYDELPIRTTGNPGNYFLANKNLASNHYQVRVAPESPILASNFYGVVPLVDWRTKGIELGYTDYDATTLGAKFVFSAKSLVSDGAYAWTDKSSAGAYPRALGVFVTGVSGETDAVLVSAEPEETGAPSPAFGTLTDGVSAGATIPMAYPDYMDATGCGKVATGWRKYVLDPALHEFVFADEGEGKACDYVHPDPSARTRFVWTLADVFLLTVNVRGRGVVTGGETGVVISGAEKTLTAAAEEGWTFAGWYDGSGAKLSSDATLQVTVDAPKTVAAVFFENGGVIACYPEVGDYQPILAERLADASDDDVIRLEAGVYRIGSSLPVNRKVTLKGTEDDRTVLLATYERKENSKLDATLVISAGARVEHVAVTGGRVTCTWNSNGAGLIIYDGTLAYCHVTNNFTKCGNAPGGAIWASAAETNSIVITHCTLADTLGNTGNATKGAGVFATGKGSITIDNCLIVNNRAQTTSVSSTYASGGGIYTDGYDVTIANCTVVGNRTDYRGGGIYLGQAARIYNCIFVNNEAASETSVYGPDVSGNLQSDGALSAAINAAATNVLVGAGWTAFGLSGLATDPLLNDTYGLKAGSPAIGAGAWVEGLTETDRNGTPRTEGAVDLGCFVYVPSTEPEVSIAVDIAEAFDDQAFDVRVEAVNLPAGATVEKRFFIVDGDTAHPVTADADGKVTVTRAGTWKLRVDVLVDGEKVATSATSSALRIGVRTAYVAADGMPQAPYETRETAAANLFDVVDYCITGTDIEIAEGTYPVTGFSRFDRGVRIHGAGVDRTVIDAGDQRSVMFLELNHPEALVEGLTVSNLAAWTQAGITVSASGGTVRNCRFTQLGASRSGAPSGVCVWLNSPQALLDGCVFDHLFDNAPNSLQDGLAVCSRNSSVTRNCLFRDCTLRAGDQPAYLVKLVPDYGKTPETFENCTFVRNTIAYAAPTAAGAMPATAAMVNCSGGDSNAPSSHLRNCIFGEPTIKTGADGEQPVWRQLVVLERNGVYKDVNFRNNCFAGTDETWGSGNADGTKLSFQRDGITPSVRSSTRNAGLRQDWMDDAADILGNPRVYGRGVDLGCVELQHGPGLILIVR